MYVKLTHILLSLMRVQQSVQLLRCGHSINTYQVYRWIQPVYFLLVNNQRIHEQIFARVIHFLK
jgi:hypothetical protein